MCFYEVICATIFLVLCASDSNILMRAVSRLQYRMVDPAHSALDESYTPEDDSHEVHSVFSDEGTTRRPDNGVNAP